jgi:AcrR family transcriptional regulator
MLTLLTVRITMEAEFIEGSVRTRLIVAGINELWERGIKDFSLRRTALAAEVSCAAPYRHFKDKEEFISEIIKYIASKWELLCHEIESVFDNDVRRRIIELSVSTFSSFKISPIELIDSTPFEICG